MPHYNILIGCDQKYYDNWAKILLQSIHYHNPMLKLHCHVVNPSNLQKFSYVNYTTEIIEIKDENSMISYLQSVRFLQASKIPTNEYVITLDADTICTRPFLQNELDSLFGSQSILQHPKDGRWLAGLVAYRQDNFRLEFANKLNSISPQQWEWGRDQNILAELSETYKFVPVNKSIMSIGKNRNESVFLTLKGDQKYTEKYLNIYRKYIND